jgi:hypothetical protein
MGNYHAILMEFDTQTKKNMLSSKVTKAGMINRFQDDRCRHVGNSSACYKMGNYHRTLMKIGIHTKQNILMECKHHQSGSLGQRNSKNQM